MIASETVGCINVICSDKTGTLIENKMTVTAFYDENWHEKQSELSSNWLIHNELHILSEEHIAVEAKDIIDLNDEEFTKILQKISVIARSTALLLWGNCIPLTFLLKKRKNATIPNGTNKIKNIFTPPLQFDIYSMQ